MPEHQVLLSDHHENPEHARAVKRLGDLLWQANPPVVLDSFFLDENPGVPNEGGWPTWCEPWCLHAKVSPASRFPSPIRRPPLWT